MLATPDKPVFTFEALFLVSGGHRQTSIHKGKRPFHICMPFEGLGFTRNVLRYHEVRRSYEKEDRF